MTDAPDEFPGSIRAVIPHPFGGAVAIAGFPGLDVGVDGAAVFDPALCRQTVQGLRDYGAQGLTVLVERDELDQHGFDLLEATCVEAGMPLAYCAIADFSVPEAAMAAKWSAGRAARKVQLQSGATLAFCCQHGAGRSGLMAALCLMDAGLGAQAAIETVRSQFDEAIESPEQESWVASRSSASEDDRPA